LADAGIGFGIFSVLDECGPCYYQKWQSNPVERMMKSFKYFLLIQTIQLPPATKPVCAALYHILLVHSLE